MLLWSKMLAKLPFACQVVRFFDLKCWPSLILLARLYVSLIQHVEQVGFCLPGCMFLGSRMLAELAFVYQAVCFFELKCWPTWFLLARLYASMIQSVDQVGFCLPGGMFLWFNMLTKLVFVGQAVCFFDLKCWPSLLLLARQCVSLIKNIDQVGFC